MGGALAAVAGWRETARREAYLPDLEAMVQRQPNDGRLLALLGARLVEASEYPAAASRLEQAATGGATNAAVWLTLSAARAATGDRAGSWSVLQTGLRAAPPREQPVLRAALARCRALPANVSLPELAEAICPGRTQPLRDAYAAGSALNAFAEWRGRRDPAHSGFATREYWAREAPKSVTAQAAWVDALARNRRLREAESAANRLVALAPESPQAHLALGDVLFQGGIYLKAGLSYKKALRLRPDWLPALMGLGNVAVEKRLIPLAVQTFENATRLAPRSPGAWIGLGRAYANQRLRWDKALTAFQTAERLAPGRTDYFAYYSDALRSNYRPEAAEALLRRRVGDAPNDARSRYLLALVLLDTRPSVAREAEAETALRAALKTEPNVPATQRRLAQLLLDHPERPRAADEAITLLRSALEGEPLDHLSMTLIARAYQRLGRTAEARTAARRAVRLSDYAQQVAQLQAQEDRNPLDVQVHRRLAALFESGGEQDKARRQREMAFMLQNHPRAAARGLSVLNDATSSAVAPFPLPTPLSPGAAATGSR